LALWAEEGRETFKLARFWVNSVGMRYTEKLLVVAIVIC
jgi:hypothetical protein